VISHMRREKQLSMSGRRMIPEPGNERGSIKAVPRNVIAGSTWVSQEVSQRVQNERMQDQFIEWWAECVID